MTCDQAWATQKAAEPQTGPQSHIVQARINQDYQATANGYKVSGKKTVNLTMNGVTDESLQDTRIKNVDSQSLTIEFVESLSYQRVGAISAKLNANGSALVFAGKLNLEDVLLEGHLFQYGDISRSAISAGLPLSATTLKPDTSNADLSQLYLNFNSYPALLAIQGRARHD